MTVLHNQSSKEKLRYALLVLRVIGIWGEQTNEELAKPPKFFALRTILLLAFPTLNPSDALFLGVN